MRDRKGHSSVTVWFTADPHIGHERIIELCNRPFSSIEEMDEELLSHWRSLSNGDILYVLGDVAFKWHRLVEAFESMPRGTQAHLCWGNHDPKKRNLIHDVGRVVWAGDRKSIKVEGQHIIIDHWPMRTWDRSHHGTWQLYGHEHGSIGPFPNQLDVGVDNAYKLIGQYRPLSFEEVKQHITLGEVPHHGGTA